MGAFLFFRLLSLSVRSISLPVGNTVYKDGQPVQENSEFPVTRSVIQGAADVSVECVQKLHDFPFCMVVSVKPVRTLYVAFSNTTYSSYPAFPASFPLLICLASF